MKEIENCNGLRGSTGRLHHKPYGGETGSTTVKMQGEIIGEIPPLSVQTSQLQMTIVRQ